MLLPSTFKHKAYSLIRFCFHCEMITDLPMSRRFRCRDFFACKLLQGQLPIRCAIGRMRERVAFSLVLLHGRKETAEPGTLTLRPAAPGAATLPPRDLWPPCPMTCGHPAPRAADPPPRELLRPCANVLPGRRARTGARALLAPPRGRPGSLAVGTGSLVFLRLLRP